MASDSEEHQSLFQRFEDWYLAKSGIWLWTGLAVVVTGILLGGTRDLNELTLTSLILAGVSSGPTYQGAVTVDTLIQHSTEQLLLLGMSFFKLGIGGYIYTIVKNLESTEKHARAQLAPDSVKPNTSFFRRAFPPLLVLGTDVQFINVGVLMVIWDLNALNLLNLQFTGVLAGAAYAQALTIERVIGTLVVPVEMLGATFMLTGIPLGLASIVYNLRLQLILLPQNIWRTVSGSIDPIDGSARPANLHPANDLFGKKTLVATMTAFAIGVSGLFAVAPFRVANILAVISNTLDNQTTGAVYYSRVLFDRVIGMTTEQWLFIGLGLVILSVNLWLRQIIDALERTRGAVSKILTDTTGTTITSVEKNLWPTRIALPLAILGFLFMLINFVLGLAADSTFVVQNQAQVAGTSGGSFQQSVIDSGVYTILTRNVKFASFGLLLTAVGFNLISIMINLKQTASTLLNSFPRILTYFAAGRKRPDVAGEIVLPGSMSLAPWRSIAFIVIGGVVAFSAFFPFSFLEIQSFLQYTNLGFASQDASASYVSAFLAERLWEHTLLPFKLTGMGLMLFGVGRTFGTIVGYVKARTTLLKELIDSIHTLAKSQTEQLQVVVRSQPWGSPSSS